MNEVSERRRAVWERKSETRRARALASALCLAEEGQFTALTREAVAARAGLSPASVSYAFGGMDKLREAVMSEAVRLKSLRVVAQGLAVNDPVAIMAPASIKQAARNAL